MLAATESGGDSGDVGSGSSLGLAHASSAALARQEHVADVLRLRRAVTAGVLIWIVFGLGDALATMLVQPDALTWLLGIRAAVTVLVVPAMLRLRRPPLPSAAVARACDLWVFGLGAFAISLMCVRFGGFTSPYVGGLSVALVARGAFIVQPWQRSLVPTLIIVLSFPAVMVAAAPFSDLVSAQLADRATVGHAVAVMSLVTCVAVLSMAAGHSFWQVRRQALDKRAVGPYQLERQLGSGGMGDVWQAFRMGKGAPVALKLMRPSAGKLEDAVLRFEREISAMSRLRHENTVRILDYGVTDAGLWFDAMELVDGEDLDKYLERTGLVSIDRALQIACQIVAALSEAHEHGIVHRDVKPANVLRVRDAGSTDFVKLVDFGVARIAEEAKLTRTGAVVGTPAYMAPEAARGMDVDARADVYSVGALLYHLLAGRPPFQRDNPGDTLIEVLTKEPVPPSTWRGEPLPAELEADILRCLAKDANARFPDAGALLERLESHRAAAGLPARSLATSDPPAS
ncbi:MAG TPA: serine/threonine-protein kinase [Kofleriaceae bacterium]|nr:serine/threonine-protein kinase [Kofleriaceae bacterium]